MKQIKAKVIQVLERECLCEAETGWERKIAIRADISYHIVEQNDTVLVEYGYTTDDNGIYSGTVIAVHEVEQSNKSTKEALYKGMYDPQWHSNMFNDLLDRARSKDTHDSFKWVSKVTPTEEREMQQHLVELLLKNFYTVGIRFKNSHKVYTYKVDLDTKLLEEDQVVVQTTSGFEIVEVVRIDEGMNIDVTSDIKYKFIVQKLDLTQYNELCDKDKNVAGVIATSAAEKQRQEIVETFTGALDDKQIKLLSDCGVEGVKRL